MLFASTEVAARIERAECGLLTAAARAVAMRRPEIGVEIRKLWGGVATYAGKTSPLNKVAGLGFAAKVDEQELARVESMFAQREVPVQVELSCLADPSVGALLTSRGYRLVGFENVLGRGLAPEALGAPDDARTGVVISVSDASEFPTWLDTVVSGFASPDSQGVQSHESYPREVLERVMDDMARAEGFVRYLARRDGEPAGGASMRMGEAVAQMCGASTLPEHRRMGVQTALLAHRLRDAARAGCDMAVVTVQPGSQSQRNVQRRGFELLYTRAVLVLEE
jgi:GNAT superfamily N-acetyltransferase